MSTPRAASRLAPSSPWQVHTQSSRHLFTLHLFANVFLLSAYCTCYARMHAELLFLALSTPLVQSCKPEGHDQFGCAPADAAVGPFALALKRFGATLKDFPNLAKYVETVGVSNAAALLMRGRGPLSINITERQSRSNHTMLVAEHFEAH